MANTPTMTPGTYSLDFTEKQWEELISMSFAPFEFGEGDALTRGQWMAIAHMALGKAERIEKGDFGAPEEEETEGDEEWVEELRDIANIILSFFRPGDGKI